jgi:hypothetical protein
MRWPSERVQTTALLHQPVQEQELRPRPEISSDEYREPEALQTLAALFRPFTTDALKRFTKALEIAEGLRALDPASIRFSRRCC